MSKHFILNPQVEFSSSDEIEKRNQIKKGEISDRLKEYENSVEKILAQQDTLKHVHGRVVVKLYLQNKNFHTFSDGTKIKLERQFNNLNRRYTEPVNAYVISAEDIPKDSEILVHPNGITETNKINGYKEDNLEIGYYSVPREQCFIWYDGKEWAALYPFETALRVYQPYIGSLEGIEPTLIPNCLFVTSGDLKGKIVITLKACDYTVVFQDKNGQEGNIIRFRPHGEPETDREPEAICISEVLTEQLKKNKILIGLSEKDCKTYKEWQNQ